MKKILLIFVIFIHSLYVWGIVVIMTRHSFCLKRRQLSEWKITASCEVSPYRTEGRVMEHRAGSTCKVNRVKFFGLQRPSPFKWAEKNRAIERLKRFLEKQNADGVWSLKNWTSGSHSIFTSLWVSKGSHSASFYIYFLQYWVINILPNNIFFFNRVYFCYFNKMAKVAFYG